MKNQTKFDRIFTTIFGWIIGIVIVGAIIEFSVIPTTKWVYTDIFDYHAYASAYGNITDGETVDVYLSGHAFRENGKMRYVINAIAIGQEVWHYDPEEIQPGSEIQIVDDDENLWTINIPESETVSPYKRIIASNLLFLALVAGAIIFVRYNNKQKQQTTNIHRSEENDY